MTLDSIPESWLLSSIAEVCEINPKLKADDELDVGFMPMSEMPTEYRGMTNHEVKKWRDVKKGYTQFKDGDTLFAKITPCFENGKAAIVRNFPNAIGAGSTEYYVLRPKQNVVLPELLLALVKTKEFLIGGETNMTGSVGHKRVPKEYVEGYPVPLPPLAEQRQIAAKLDELLAQVDTIKTRLDAIPHTFKRFRQSVLAAAVSGKLTEEWRGRVLGNSESHWKYKRTQDVCAKVQSGSTPRDNPFDQNGTIPFLKVYNIVNQKIDFDYKPQFVTEAVHRGTLNRSVALPNDVLMNIVGPPLGKVAILTNQFPEWNINQAITFFRADPNTMSYQFLYYVLCEGRLVRDVMPDTKGSVGQVNISLSQCRDFVIPVPPLEEQTEIVRRVEQLVAYADQIEQRVRDAQARVNHLTQSILAKAFRGELTADWRAQNPDLISGDNSAEALLARIRAERESTAGKPKNRKRKTS